MIYCINILITTINMNRTHESDDLSGDDDAQEV